MGIAVNLAISACQQSVLAAVREKPRTFAELFELCELRTDGRVGPTSHERILDRSLQGLRRHGDIVYSRKTVMWHLAEEK
jgi:hypothetical protein